MKRDVTHQERNKGFNIAVLTKPVECGAVVLVNPGICFLKQGKAPDRNEEVV
jgi:hypothetical protein